jgi:cytochrome b6-f complex iron-sulfur subunit
MALFLVQFGGITWFFSMPRFRAGEFGGVIPVRAEDFPATNAPPVSNNAGKFWLVQTDAGINTLYKICTHLGCIYPWSDAASIFACPCHGSQFQLNGDWIAGPAARSLDKFAFEVLDASGAVIASATDGNPIPMPAGAATVRVNTGAKILGKSHF